MPCRGTGAVVSYLGGEANSVSCPWCEGTGTRHPGIDAQARWLAAPVEGGEGGAGLGGGGVVGGGGVWFWGGGGRGAAVCRGGAEGVGAPSGLRGAPEERRAGGGRA